MTSNQQIILDNRPHGEASPGNFRLISSEIPPLQDGQVLVRHHYLSLDPYMRGRMNDAKSYADPQPRMFPVAVTFLVPEKMRKG